MGIVITDGYSSDKDATWRQAMNNRASDITMLAIGVTNSIRMSELRSIASFPPSKNMWMVNNFDDLPSITRDVADAMCNGRLLPCLTS